MTGKISVIIPCYNVQMYVAECLNSVLNQTYKNFEIICVDDGSSDNTLKLLNDFKEKYPSLISIISSSNKGAPAARNLGLKAAQGDFIQFLDADDIITHDKFEKQLSGFDPNVDAVLSDRMQKNHDLTKVLNTYYFNDIETNPLETAITKVITTCNPIYKKEIVLQLGGHNESLNSAQDWDFHIRFVLSGFKINYIPGIFFINRKVAGSISSNWIKVSLQAAEVITTLKSKLIESQWMNKNIKQYIAQLYMNSAIYSKNFRQSKIYVNELEFWAKNDYSFISSYLKRLSVKIIGIDIIIRLQRVFKN